MQALPISNLALRSPVPPAITVLVLSLIGTAVAVAEHLPYGFGGHGHANDVWGDFLTRGGTALSPPLPTLVLLIVFTVLAPRATWVGALGRVGLLIGACAFIIGIAGEPLTHRVLNPSHAEPFKALLIVLALAASTAMGTAAVLGLRNSRHAPQTSPLL